MENNYKDDSYLNDFKPLEVEVTGRLEDAIHRFRSLVTKEKVMSYLKLHYSYEKPSDRKRRKIRESIQRQKKATLDAKKYGLEQKV
ncbi:MAG: 30S ribosomal protein S21 [Bacteroidia bacterium]